MRPARCAAGTCDHNCSGKCFYLVRPSHPVQLMVGTPLGPDMNSLLYTLREMYKAEDEGNETAWHTSYTTLRAMIEAISK